VAEATTIKKDDVGGKGNTRFIFGNKAPSASLSVARSSLSIPDGTTVDTESFKELDDYYNSLNGLVRSYTPTEFALGMFSIDAVTNMLPKDSITYFGEEEGGYWWLSLSNEKHYTPGDKGSQDFIIPLVDFTDMSTLTMYRTLVSGSTTKVFSFSFTYGDNGNPLNELPKITFILDDKVHNEHWLRTYDNRVIARDGNKVSVRTEGLLSYSPSISFYNGTVYKRFSPSGNGSYSEEYYKFLGSLGLNDTRDDEAKDKGWYEDKGNLFIPMNTVHIPSDAKDIDVTVNWYLKGIIEQYQGHDGQDDTADDVFVLAKDFWQRLSLSVSTK